MRDLTCFMESIRIPDECSVPERLGPLGPETAQAAPEEPGQTIHVRQGEQITQGDVAPTQVAGGIDRALHRSRRDASATAVVPYAACVAKRAREDVMLQMMHDVRDEMRDAREKLALVSQEIREIRQSMDQLREDIKKPGFTLAFTCAMLLG